MLVLMPEGVFRRGFRLALWGCVLVVAWLAFAPVAEPVGFSWDKANHVLAFCVMAALADGGYPGRDRELPRWGLLLGYGLVIELVQWQLPYRESPGSTWSRTWSAFCSTSAFALGSAGAFDARTGRFAAVKAIERGIDVDREGRPVHWEEAVAAAVAAKRSLPPDAVLPLPASAPDARTRVQVAHETTLVAAKRRHPARSRPWSTPAT
jgi:hypothetical protein